MRGAGANAPRELQYSAVLHMRHVRGSVGLIYFVNGASNLAEGGFLNTCFDDSRLALVSIVVKIRLDDGRRDVWHLETANAHIGQISIKLECSGPNAGVAPLSVQDSTLGCLFRQRVPTNGDNARTALMISVTRGTPMVTFMLATPAKWNVCNVICVAGSPIDCAATAPSASPG